MTQIIIQSQDTQWLNYWNPQQAYEDFIAHLASLPSHKTQEKHTLRVYKSGIEYYLTILGRQLPTPSLVQRFIAHLLNEKEWGSPDNPNYGLKASTVGSKYLAPLRKYIEALASQPIDKRLDGTPLSETDRHYIGEAREQMRAALAVPTPKPDETSNLPALYQHGERLTLKQVNQLYASCDPDTIAGSRDLAILYLGFTSALRAAELQRMTLAKIRQESDGWRIYVRGKRNNVDPVPMDDTAYQLIMDYIRLYNADLEEDDPRYITRERPLWQAIQHNDTHFPLGYQQIDPGKGISAQSIRAILKTHCEQVQDYDETFPVIAPHDMRRTAAALAHSANMDYPQIQRLLRHKSLSTTFLYIGSPPDLSKSKLSNYVNFTLPSRQLPRQQRLTG